MTEPIARTESREEMLSMVFCFLKMKAWAMWLKAYPETKYQDFELIWPALFDQMLAAATAQAVEKLAEQVKIEVN